MSNGIIIPGDRTIKQPARGYCMNPACRERSTDGQFEFVADHDLFACPKCGNNQKPGVGLLTLIHMLLPAVGGKLDGKNGQSFDLACDDNRAYIATATNQEQATGDVRFVNCPGCLANPATKQVKQAGTLIQPDA